MCLALTNSTAARWSKRTVELNHVIVVLHGPQALGLGVGVLNGKGQPDHAIHYDYRRPALWGDKRKVACQVAVHHDWASAKIAQLMRPHQLRRPFHHDTPRGSATT